MIKFTKNKYRFLILISLISISFFSCASTNNQDKTIDTTISSIPSDTVGKKLTVVTNKKVTESIPRIVSPIEQYKKETAHTIVSAISSPSEIMKGKTFNSPFIFKVYDSNNNPIEATSVTILYPSFSKNGKVSFATEEMVTDSAGKVAFKAHIAEFSCNDFIWCYVTPTQIDDAVTQYITENAAKIAYKVYTDKVWSAYSISILDYTEAGAPVRTTSATSSAVSLEMYKKNLHVGNSDWIDEIDKGDETVLYKNAKSLFGNNIDYLVHGKLTYLDGVTTNKNGNKTLKWNISYGVMNMKTGEDVLSDSFVVTGEDTNEWKLLDSLRHNKIAPAIVDAIYYGI